MKVLIYGATGMVGQGVLLECLQAPEVSAVRTVGRSPSLVQHPKLSQTVKSDLQLYSAADLAELDGYDACFFCLGISSWRMSEADYTRITYDLTMAAATALAAPGMTFVYITGQGTDSTEQGKTMWARVKGKTENALLRLPFKGAYMLRPAAIEAHPGVQSKTNIYRWIYKAFSPLFPLAHKLFPNYVTSTRQIGRVMIHLAQHGSDKQRLETADINSALG